jgi:hypothetical protein
MPSGVRLVLATLPLGIYFFVLGAWRCGRSPRVVSGPLDFGLLAFGLGGLVAFGPIGELLVDRLFPEPSVWAWLALASTLWLLALLWAPRAARRVIVYNVEPETLRKAVADGLLALPGQFAPTLRGYEDRESGRGLAVEVGRAHTATVEAYGQRPDLLAAEVASLLRERLLEAPTAKPVGASWPWFALSSAALVIPWVGLVLSRPIVRAALQEFLTRIRGG